MAKYKSNLYVIDKNTGKRIYFSPTGSGGGGGDTGTSFKFKGYASVTPPTGKDVKKDELWLYCTTGTMPVQTSYKVKVYDGTNWIDNTEDYVAGKFDVWANLNSGLEYYWFNGEWNVIDAKGEGSGGDYLPLSGGTLTGDLNFVSSSGGTAKFAELGNGQFLISSDFQKKYKESCYIELNAIEIDPNITLSIRSNDVGQEEVATFFLAPTRCSLSVISYEDGKELKATFKLSPANCLLNGSQVLTEENDKIDTCTVSSLSEIPKNLRVGGLIILNNGKESVQEDVVPPTPTGEDKLIVTKATHADFSENSIGDFNSSYTVKTTPITDNLFFIRIKMLISNNIEAGVPTPIFKNFAINEKKISVRQYLNGSNQKSQVPNVIFTIDDDAKCSIYTSTPINPGDKIEVSGVLFV